VKVGTWVRSVTLALAALLGACASSAEREAEAARKERLVQTDLQLAIAYLERNNLPAAKERLEKTLTVSPNDPQVNNVMAVVEWRFKEYDKAERHFRKALDEAPRNASVNHNFGAYLCDRGRAEEGVKHLEKAAADPTYNGAAEALLNAGVCLMRKPAPATAEKYFREALKLNPRLPGALYYMAKINYDSGRTFTARGFIDRYYEVGQDTPEALLLAYYVERALKNTDAAATYAVRLRGKFPNSPETEQLKRELTGQRTR
jgi:type IV pilus assembly protein PilF